MLALFGHPGHELLVGQLLADTNATVCWLSDGSGGAQTDRSGYTRSLLADCACAVGSVHGFASDKAFYAAIMDGNAGFFDSAIEALEATIHALRPSVILTDPMEYFNPLHDLANTVTDILIAKSARKPGLTIGKLVYANEYPEHFATEKPAALRTLTAAEQEEQMRRLAAYVPLHAEWRRMEQSGKLLSMDVERLYPDPLRFEDIPPASQTRFKSAYYEDYGRAAVAKGIYQSSLTFADHALPFARQLVQRHLGTAQ
ncbi:MAG: hypothetical protein WCC66_13785 [Rhizobiaceae bacterium]